MKEKTPSIETFSATLAVDGGTPAVAEGPPDWPVPDDDVREALARTSADGSWARYHGPHCERLVRLLAEMHSREFVTLTCSGTFAVELALRSLGIASGDEVILAGYDFPGNFRAIEALGAHPVLVDIDPDCWCLDARQLPAAISERTRAMIVSHLHGGLASMRVVMQLAAEHDLDVVEDACQAPGATVDGRIAGTWGDVGVLSFGGSKLLSAGRGGAILTAKADVHQRAKIFCQRGNDAFPLSELQAAVLCPQMGKLAERNERRQASVKRLLEPLGDMSGLRPIVNRAADALPSFYKFAWLYEKQELGGRAIDEFIKAIGHEGVAIDSGFRGFTLRSDRRCRKVGSLEHSERAASDTLLLHHPVLLQEPEVIDRVAIALKKVTGAFASRGK